MSTLSFRLPSKVTYWLFIGAEVGEALCRLVLSYALSMCILALPPVMAMTQRLSSYGLENPTALSVRQTYLREATQIIFSGKVFSGTFTAREIQYLLNFRQIVFQGLVLAIIALVLLLYLVVNHRYVVLLLKSHVYQVLLASVAGLTLLVATFFPLFFSLGHVWIFGDGPDLAQSSALMQALPMSFWFVNFLFVHIGVMVSLIVQTLHARSQEI